MKALELADAYADAVSTHRLECLYGTRKSYTLEKAKERDEAFEALTAELRRLAVVEAERDALKADETPEKQIKRTLRDLYQEVLAERDALKAENERLTNCLKKANDQAEDFERRWYLADMELERIKALEHRAHLLKAEDDQIAMLTAQRDELLAALLELRGAAERYLRMTGGHVEKWSAIHTHGPAAVKEMQRLIEQSGAAIAKAVALAVIKAHEGSRT